MLRLHSAPTALTEQLFTAEQILDIQWRLAEVHATDALMDYIVDLAEASRQHPDEGRRRPVFFRDRTRSFPR